MHQLAHGIGNYLETHGWPEARYSAQQDWVQPELLTNTDAVKSLFTLHDLLLSLFICHAQLHNLPYMYSFRIKSLGSHLIWEIRNDLPNKREISSANISEGFFFFFFLEK